MSVEAVTRLRASLHAAVDAACDLIGAPVVVPPVDPPPPVPTQSAFMKAAVYKLMDVELRCTPKDGFSTPPNIDAFNTSGKSFGLSAWLFFHPAPSMVAPINMTSGQGSLWTLAAVSDRLLRFIAVRPGGGDMTLELPVDSMVGRWTHVVVGFDLPSKLLAAWVDRVHGGPVFCPDGVGFSATYTPPLQFNTNEAGFNLGDFSRKEVVYSVGAAPTQEDVISLYGPDDAVSGFSVGVVE